MPQYSGMSPDVAVRSKLNEHDVERDDSQNQESEHHAGAFPAGATPEHYSGDAEESRQRRIPEQAAGLAVCEVYDRVHEGDRGECRANGDSGPSQGLQCPRTNTVRERPSSGISGQLGECSGMPLGGLGSHDE
jgi:hypothetical protein